MRILYVSNHNTQMCGVANYGRQCYDAAKSIGLDIDGWDASHPGALPDDAMDYDRIHLNWIAGTLGHLQPIDIPRGPRVSIFLHEPDSKPEGIIERCDSVIAAEERPWVTHLLEPPCPSYEPMTDWAHQPPELRELVFGISGIRKTGLDRLEPAVEMHNRELAAKYDLQPGEVPEGQWRISQGMESPDAWLSDEAEIERLAQCTLNVAHYHGGYGGQGTGVMTLIAARRPVLINSNQMLTNLFGESELYRVEDVRAGIELILQDIRDGRERRPLKLAERRSWKKQIWKMKEAWSA